jgi:serpin B
MVLAMAGVGSRGNTASQILKTTGLPEKFLDSPLAFKALLGEMRQTNDSGCQLAVANSLWVQRGFPVDESFERNIADDFNGHLGMVDFAASPGKAADEINSWFKAQTYGLIPKMIGPDSLRAQTDLILADTAYFRGRWTAGFKVQNTQSGPFKLDSTHSVSASIMSGVNKYGYMETEDLQVLEMFFMGPEFFSEPLPLNSNRFSMVILLPKNPGELKSLEHSLTDEEINKLLGRIVVTEVSVSLPRFSMSSSFNLKSSLQKMGMSDAFSEERADFSKISTKRPLFINDVCHTSWLRVDESGAEAAAGAFIRLTHGAPPEDFKIFNADHPFIFMIRDNQTGIILFLGRVANPSE